MESYISPQEKIHVFRSLAEQTFKLISGPLKEMTCEVSVTEKSTNELRSTVIQHILITARHLLIQVQGHILGYSWFFFMVIHCV